MGDLPSTLTIHTFSTDLQVDSLRLFLEILVDQIPGVNGTKEL